MQRHSDVSRLHGACSSSTLLWLIYSCYRALNCLGLESQNLNINSGRWLCLTSQKFAPLKITCHTNSIPLILHQTHFLPVIAQLLLTLVSGMSNCMHKGIDQYRLHNWDIRNRSLKQYILADHLYCLDIVQEKPQKVISMVSNKQIPRSLKIGIKRDYSSAYITHWSIV